MPICMSTSLSYKRSSIEPTVIPVGEIEVLCYGVPLKLTNLIEMLYTDLKSFLICNAALTETFSVITGLKQGCILLPYLFILGIDLITKRVISSGRREIRWTLTSISKDLDYADDTALFSHSYQDT